MQPAFFKSDFAILDVKDGRGDLARKIKFRGGPVHVRVDMMINYASGNDDGISQEFACTVLSVKEFVR